MDPSQRPNPNTDPASESLEENSAPNSQGPTEGANSASENEEAGGIDDANPLIDKNSKTSPASFEDLLDDENHPHDTFQIEDISDYEFFDSEDEHEEGEALIEIPLSEAAATFFPGIDGLLNSTDELPLIELPPGEDLVAIGGDLSPERLLQHYSNGLFPWFEDNSPILWWSPDPRAILPLDGVHISKSLKKTLRQKKFKVTIDQAFFEVIRGCQVARRDGTWITESMIQAYCEMHRLGFAHSVEVWQDGKLVGGIYGIALGGFFAGESMFYKVSNASKIALIGLVDHLNAQGFELFDLQIINDHTQSMGGIEIPKAKYFDLLHSALSSQVKF